jgi:hypothetical protein
VPKPGKILPSMHRIVELDSVDDFSKLFQSGKVAMYMITVGLMSGEYVASCARNRCGYFGEPLPLSTEVVEVIVNQYLSQVFMEHLYDKIGVPINLYDRRGWYLIYAKTATGTNV